MSKELKNWLNKNYNLIIFIFLLLVTVVPMIKPIGLPIPISENTADFYNIIDGIEEGDIIWFDINFSPSRWAELGPQAIATVKHIWSKGGKVLFISSDLYGPQMYDLIIDKAKPPESYEYGIDWVNLGYIIGGETAIASLSTDVFSVVKTDKYGNALEDLSMMYETPDGSFVKLIIVVTEGVSAAENYVRQLKSKYDTTIICGLQAQGVTTVQPYLTAGLISAVLPGARGAAELEVLTKRLGVAITITDALSLAQIYLLILIILGNIIFILEKSREKKVKGGIS